MADLGIRYATALFDIAQEGNLLNDYYSQAQLICDNIKSEEAQRVLKHPMITADEKFAFLNNAFGKNVHQDLLGFMQLVVSKNREAFLLSALSRLVEMIRAHNLETTAKVVSAVELSSEQVTSLTALLSKKLGKKVDVNLIVDPSMIAGISIHVDGFFVDRSIKTMLRDMKENIKGE